MKRDYLKYLRFTTSVAALLTSQKQPMTNNTQLPAEEIWKPVLGYENRYEVSNTGKVRSSHFNEPIILSTIVFYGYVVVSLCNLNIKRNRRMHRLVAQAFIPNPENKPQVNHKDKNKLNNHVDNLEWATNQENVRHSIAMMNGKGTIFEIGNNKPKPVYCPEDHAVYKSLAEASRFYCIDKTTIKTYIKTKYKTRSGKSFQWYTNQKEDKQ